MNHINYVVEDYAYSNLSENTIVLGVGGLNRLWCVVWLLGRGLMWTILNNQAFSYYIVQALFLCCEACHKEADAEYQS